MNELHLFAGAGGGILGGEILGHTTVCAVEIEEYPKQILLQRQREGILPIFPVWDDVKTFDGNPWKGRVDCVCGGFPCQDISVAGKGKGLDGSRSGLWGEQKRIIGEVQPWCAFVENSPALTIRGLNRIIGDFTEMGYSSRWGTLGAGTVGNVSEGERLWIFAIKANCSMLEGLDFQKYIKPYPEEPRRRQYSRAISKMLSQDDYSRIKRDSDVISRGMDRFKAIGNAQIPIVAAIAFSILSEGLI